MAGRKIKFDEEDISEILVGDTDSESGSEAIEFEDYLEEEEEENSEQEQQKQQPSPQVETQAARNGGLLNWGPPQVRNANIQPFVGTA